MRVQVMDGRIVAGAERGAGFGKTRDTMLTTSNRLNAEPNDALPPGALGIAYTVDFLGGRMPEQKDLDAIVAKTATDPSLLSPVERAHIVTILSKFSGRSGSRTSAAGVTSNDAATAWAAKSARNVAAGVAHVADVQKNVQRLL